MKLQISITLCLLVFVAGQKDPHFVGDRTTIVHLFEWKWEDIARECETFLQQIGYGGVQISPPNENLVIQNRPWYERYQPVSYTLNTRSGDENALRDMIRRCNNVGVRIYADTVINHMAASDGIGTSGSSSQAGNKYFPGVPYGNDNFHPSCEVNNYQDANNVRNCELVGLKDLDHSQDYVRGKVVAYMNHLLDLGVAGFRIDAAKHMWPSDLQIIYGRLKNLNTDHGFPGGARPYIYQEVIDNGGEAVSRDEYTGFGAVLEFRHGTSIGNVFQRNDKLSYLVNWGPGWGFISNSGDAVVFVDNHDTQRSGDSRILTYKNSKPYKMATAFMLAHPYATTRIISSFNFQNSGDSPPQDGNGSIISPGFNSDNTCTNGYICEHRWSEIYNMVQFRNIARGSPLSNWWSNGDQQIAFCRGNVGFIAFTNGGNINQDLTVCVPTGDYCDIISGGLVDGRCSGKTVNVRDGNVAYIQLSENEQDGALAIHIGAKLN